MKIRMFGRRRKNSGYTIIEMLVVLFIVGILVGMVLTNTRDAKDRARYARVKSDMDGIIKVIVAVRDEKQKNLQQITGSVCSNCPCLGRDIRLVPDTDNCAVSWGLALGKIKTAAGSLGSGLDGVSRDPWGSPYSLDENEGETGTNDCRNDLLSSAGEDGVLGTADDIIIPISLYKTCP